MTRTRCLLISRGSPGTRAIVACQHTVPDAHPDLEERAHPPRERVGVDVYRFAAFIRLD